MKPHLPLLKRNGKKTPEKTVPRTGVSLPRVSLGIVTIVCLSVLLSFHMLPSRISLEVGHISPESIIAQRTVRYVDSAETALRREQAAASAGRVYDPVPNAADQAIGTLKTVLSTVQSIRDLGNGVPVVAKAARVRDRLGPLLGGQVSDQTLRGLLTADDKSLREIEDGALRIVSSAMSREIKEDPADVRKARKDVMADALEIAAGSAKARVVGELARCSIRPNQTYDEPKTIARQEQARKDVKPSYETIMQGDTVITKNETVLPKHIERLEALGMLHPKLDIRSVACVMMLVIIIVLLVTLYLWRYHPEVYANTKALVLLALLVVVSTLALRIGGSLLGIQLNQSQVGYLGILWVVMGAMFISVLLNHQVAVLVAALLSIVLSMILNNEMRYAASAFLTSLVGIYSVANLRDRYDLMRVAGTISGFGILLVWVIGGISSDPVSDMIAGTFWAGLVIPIPATMLFFFGTWLLERPFERTTHISLLELADTNRPLLKRLLMEAPGTYTHSMLVGHLAESAAGVIGADALLSRVASYYHDIGKIRRPHFFIENQHVENAHDNINPTLSTLVITSHIKDGVEIAKEYRLPKMVIDVLAQHHGTSLVQYFYNQFADEHDPSTAVEQQFRYGGPKPMTKEAAIVMLADSAEAASRCIDKPTPAKIELLVNRVVADRLRDGQLDESELTFREVSKITATFVRALISTMHARIEYTDAVSTDGRKTGTNGDSGTEATRVNGEGSESQEPGPTAASG